MSLRGNLPLQPLQEILLQVNLAKRSAIGLLAWRPPDQDSSSIGIKIEDVPAERVVGESIGPGTGAFNAQDPPVDAPLRREQLKVA